MRNVFVFGGTSLIRFVCPEAPGAFNGRPDPSIRHASVVGGLKTRLFEGPESIGSLWLQEDLQKAAKFLAAKHHTSAVSFSAPK